ncbi:hypothetical protein MASR1M12_24260 [Erysipelotrichia bacterium]
MSRPCPRHSAGALAGAVESGEQTGCLQATGQIGLQQRRCRSGEFSGQQQGHQFRIRGVAGQLFQQFGGQAQVFRR